jgi:hypothetical protein
VHEGDEKASRWISFLMSVRALVSSMVTCSAEDPDQSIKNELMISE